MGCEGWNEVVWEQRAQLIFLSRARAHLCRLDCSRELFICTMSVLGLPRPMLIDAAEKLSKLKKIKKLKSLPAEPENRPALLKNTQNIHRRPQTAAQFKGALKFAAVRGRGSIPFRGQPKKHAVFDRIIRQNYCAAKTRVLVLNRRFT